MEILAGQRFQNSAWLLSNVGGDCILYLDCEIHKADILF